MTDDIFRISRPGLVDLGQWQQQERKAATRRLANRGDDDVIAGTPNTAGVRVRSATTSDQDRINATDLGQAATRLKRALPSHTQSSSSGQPADVQAHEDDPRHAKTPRTEAPNKSTRRRYTAQDYYAWHASEAHIQTCFSHHPCLSQRNFYVIQNHHATAKHYDLRLHLDGGTLSWAIPKGLSDWDPSRGTEHRLAIETYPHALDYTLYEGSRVGTTAVWDLGTYKVCLAGKNEFSFSVSGSHLLVFPHQVLPTFKKQRLKTKLDQEGFDLDHDTSEEEDDDADLTNLDVAHPTAADYLEEDKLSRKYHYAAFLPTPARYDQDAKPAQRDVEGSHRGFVLELQGKRYRGLRIRFHRTAKDIKHITFPKAYARANPTDPRAQPGAPLEVQRRWMIDLVTQGYEDRSIGHVSLLTGRSIEQIKAAAESEQNSSGDTAQSEEEELWRIGILA
ncbi:BZ3500_MvSof-1268-A1-R1_Chr2-2g04843 [Microbotryum saponariae]|uniref:BZ3500_MvSof-1268-A1-R1_Chr2-2g04843 protein n=1 Tax=Microbotryum saponariae TaxID=289078 RepID=A0A2X0K5N6_9BASI|nr:BZ3500_MvSof-1268-A1-R1_Chr2-2g04843 [Microbotryum saponariae]SDA00302.1 BZ3501_MvSof-1269-A2-R1_Chr2-2g04517 [Microbotryum saponariae]